MQLSDYPSTPDKRLLLDLTIERMPFGRYKGTLLCNLPEPYLVWMSNNGFPEGRLGVMLSSLLEIKSSGLGYLLKNIQKME
ncbi:MAG: DUF3820 family protein [Dehalococcoidia bacterium]|nr:DUF3820 family protein [Dehalococcoidia bacterium]